jgi:hypothetical protein
MPFISTHIDRFAASPLRRFAASPLRRFDPIAPKAKREIV